LSPSLDKGGGGIGRGASPLLNAPSIASEWGLPLLKALLLPTSQVMEGKNCRREAKPFLNSPFVSFSLKEEGGIIIFEEVPSL